MVPCLGVMASLPRRFDTMGLGDGWASSEVSSDVD